MDFGCAGRNAIRKRSPGKPAFAIIVALLLLPLFGAEATYPIEVVPPTKAWSQLLESWESFRYYLDEGNLAAAREELQLVMESKRDGAMGALPAHSIALIRLAEEFHNKGELETAAWLGEFAHGLAPKTVSVHLALARYNLGGGPIAPGRSLSHYIRSIKIITEDFPGLYRFLGRLSIYPVVFLALFGFVFSVTALFRYAPLLAHDFRDLYPADIISGWMTRGLLAVLLLLPLAAGFSFWWLICCCLIVLSLYMKRSERLLVYLWLIALLATPWLLEYHTIFAGARSDHVLQAALRVRNGVIAGADREVLEDTVSKRPDDMLARFSLARLLTREGRFNKAVLVYEPALKDPRTAQEAYNNVAEIYMWDRNLDTVYLALSEATEAGPQRAEIMFNLGQYFLEAEDHTRMEEYFNVARSIDEARLDEMLVLAKERKLNRFMASLPVPWPLVWERSIRGSALSSAALPGIWNKWMGPPGGLLSWPRF